MEAWKHGRSLVEVDSLLVEVEPVGVDLFAFRAAGFDGGEHVAAEACPGMPLEPPGDTLAVVSTGTIAEICLLIDNFDDRLIEVIEPDVRISRIRLSDWLH